MGMAKMTVSVLTNSVRGNKKKIIKKKKASFQIRASLFITPKLPSMAVQNLSVFKCYLLHIQSLFREYRIFP